jgi:hypothetical protein
MEQADTSYFKPLCTDLQITLEVSKHLYFLAFDQLVRSVSNILTKKIMQGILLLSSPSYDTSRCFTATLNNV